MRIPAVFGSLLVGAVITAFGCSSGSPGGGGASGGTSGAGGSGGASGSGGTAGSPSDAGADVPRGVMGGDSGPGANTNPYGIAYPTENIGTTARGTAAGSQMQNFAFLGYLNKTPGTKTVDTGSPVSISLADFYDPENKQYKLLHISVAAEWCTPCNEETVEVTGGAKMLASKGVVLLQALTEGYAMGTGAVTNDLHTWIGNHAIDYNMVLDPEATNLGAFFNEAAIPWNADIDVRTMEILDDGVGYDGHAVSDIESQLAWVESHPPSYACPTGLTLSGKSCK